MRGAVPGSLIAAAVAVVAAPPAGAQAARNTPQDHTRPPALTVRASGAPRTVQFARATVPPGIPRAAAVRYAIVPTGEAPLVTRELTGVLPPGDARGVLVSFSIPARSLAGTLPVATVRYTTAGGATASTAVQATVTPVRAMAMTVLQAVRGARPGESLDIAYRVSNLGNVTDTAILTLQLPHGWAVQRGADTVRVTIAPGSAVERTARVTVGRTASTGSYTIRLATHLGSSEAAIDNAFVSVVTPRDGIGSGGPVLTSSVLTASGTGGDRTVLSAMSLRGRIAGDVGIIADVHQYTTLSETNRYRLSTLGHFPQPPTVTLYNRHFRGTIGGVGANLSDITGVNAGGRGAGLSYDGETRAAQVFGASAEHAGTTPDAPAGGLYGARLAQRVGPVWITGTAAHLDEGTPDGRRLEAAGGGVIVPSVLGSGDLTAEMAWRRHRDGEGLGLLAQYVLTEQFTRVQLRAMSAPGGSAAFAPSSGSISAIASHRVSPRLTVGTFGSFDTDASSVRGSMQSHGLSITPRIQVTDRIFIAPDVATSGHRTRTTMLEFGQLEVRSGAQAGMQLGNLTLMAGGGGARVTRDALADTLPVATTTTFRTHASAGISYASVHLGALSVTADVSEDRTNASAFPRQNQVAVRVDRVPVYLAGGFRVLANGAVHRMDWYGDRPGVVQLRGDVTAELPYGFSVALAADRNPLVTLPGGGGWSTSIRAEHRTTLRTPAFLQPGYRRGMVFRDLDGDGRRGANEPGAPGIVLQRGDESVSTDGRGRFRLGPPTSGAAAPLQVDPRSLPAGWVQSATPTPGRAGPDLRDIPIVPTTHIRVQLAVSREDLGASGTLDLRRVLVIARDSLGRAWLATPDTSAAVQGFPALPPGLYILEVDPSGAGSALSVRTLPPPFRVGADRAARTIPVELATRRVRMFRSQGTAPSTPPASNPADAPASVPAAAPAPAPAPATRPRPDVSRPRRAPQPVIPRSGKDPVPAIPRSGKDPVAPAPAPASSVAPAPRPASGDPPMIIPRFGKDAFRPAAPADSAKASRKGTAP